MATSLIHFEVNVPIANDGSPQQTAIQNFLTSLSSLVPVRIIQCQLAVPVAGTSGNVFSYYGEIAVSQSTTALGFLSTLNSALVVAGSAPAICLTWNVVSQP